MKISPLEATPLTSALETLESAQLVFKLVLRRSCSVFDLDERVPKGLRLLPQEATPPN
jgi:hypothetical protein